MTVGDIKRLVMHQLNMDPEDQWDYTPYLLGYINEGYERLVKAWTLHHDHAGSENYPYLSADNDVPAIPERYHKALADFATWCIYRNGNAQKQQRGYVFRNGFEEAWQEIWREGGVATSESTETEGPTNKRINHIPW